MKPTETDVENAAAIFGIVFVNRSYGKATTKTVTLATLTKLVSCLLSTTTGQQADVVQTVDPTALGSRDTRMDPNKMPSTNSGTTESKV
jgi:hypothetical protein